MADEWWRNQDVLRDRGGVPIPQRLDADNQRFTPLYVQRPVAREPFTGSGDRTITFTRSMIELYIHNQADTPLTITINGSTFTVPAGYGFDEALTSFDEVTISAAGPYLGWGRG